MNRERIPIADLLSMSSGLRFNESHGVVSDLTRMLYMEADTAGFAHAQPLGLSAWRQCLASVLGLSAWPQRCSA
jgi:hypothetical protein